MATKLDNRQVVQRSTLSFIGNAANEALSVLFPRIDAEMAKLYEDRNILLTDGGIITFTGTQIQFTEALKIVLNQKISGASPQSISLGSSTITLANNEMWYAIIDRGAGTASTVIATTLPAVVTANQEIFLIVKRIDAGDGTQRVYWRNGMALDAGQSVRLGSAGSGDGGSGTLSVVPGYKMLISDSFTSSSATESTVDTTFTKATYDAGKKLYRLSCDKSRTVNTSSGTGITLNLAPSFTVQVGDVVYLTSGARINQWRRIATINSQTDYVLDAAFTGGDATIGDTLMVSQAVWTVDLVNFGSITELTRARDFYVNEDVNQVLVDYADSLTAGDDVADFTQTARIVMSASNQGLQAGVTFPTTNTFTTGIYTRPNAPTLIPNYALQVNADNERLFLVFFANPNNGSVTTGANLLDYIANFYEEAEAINGGVLNSAYCLSDNSSTPYNCTVSTSGGFTKVDLLFDVNPSVDPGGIGAQVAVKVNGQDVPKFVSSGVTPSSQLSYTVVTDVNGLYRRIQFSTDISISPADIIIFKQFGVYDASFTQSNKLIGLYDAIVGSSAQVTAGTATHSSLQAAHDAVVAGSNILVLNNVTLSGNTTLTKQLLITGKGIGSVLTGTITFNSGSAGTIVERLKITSTITFNVDNCYMKMVYQTTGQTLTNDGSLYPNNIIQVIGI